jgi:diguanylate cyclase (GGDEF)-like protein
MYMSGTYSPPLVLCSLLVAILASYTALDISGRIATTRSAAGRHAWLAGGALALGLGIWAVHFIGMLAWQMPIAIGFDLGLSMVSGLIAVVFSYVVLWLISRASMGRGGLYLSGALLGLGIAGMHYCGMAAMLMTPAIDYDPLWFGLSLVMAIVASTAALRIGMSLKDSRHSQLLVKRGIAALAMGVAIAGMHFAGMQAANVLPGATCGAAADTKPGMLAAVITLASVLVLLIALLLSFVESRLHRSTQRLSGSINQLNSRLLHLATHDALTGLPNRVTLSQRIELAIAEARQMDTEIAVLYIDLDGFKAINDSLGHSFGDELLRAVGGRLSAGLRRGTLARVGGDEFVAVVERLSSRETALQIAERAIARMRENFSISGTSLRVTPSIGVAFFPDDGETVDELIANADVAMYGAKEGGRNGFRVFEPDMKQKSIRILEIQRGLQTATEDGSLSLHFQSKHDGPSGDLVGAEALARWSHPTLGSVPPIEFIGVAERTGQIGRIGEWVIRETCRQLREWNSKGHAHMRVAINLSPLQLSQPDLVDMAAQIVSDAGLLPSQIMFEVTETVAMQDAERTTEILRDFQNRGFEFAIDDFGTGYSSLAYLQKFQAKQLKIDRFFTHSLESDSVESKAIVSAIIALAHTLGMEVVAEGVETLNQANQLKALNCDQVQGFYMSYPLPPLAFEQKYLLAAAVGRLPAA